MAPAGTVLVVEDDVALASVLTDYLLHELGYQVVVARDGAQARAALLAPEPYGLIFLDFHVPLLDVFELVETIRSSPQHEGTPVVLITAYSPAAPPPGRRLSRILQRLRDLPIDGWLTKPFGLDDVERILRDLGLSGRPGARAGG